ncbi:MAG TPA: ATP-binding protein [Candidatus Nitrosocosmicus sp.]|nr:ATP-binding protein [Candidatus Nitrosocosmicus sp.]
MKKNSKIESSNFSSEMMKFLNSASKELASSLDYETTLKNLSKLIVPKLADWFSIDILDENNKITLLTVNHVDPKKVKWAMKLREQDPPDPNAQTGTPQVIRSGVSEIYPDITDDLLIASAKGDKKKLNLLRKIGFRSAMVIPLKAREKTMGAISFITTNESNRLYTNTDLKLAEDFAERAALTLDNSNLYKMATQEIEERKRTEARLELAQKAGNIGTFELDIPNNEMYWSREVENIFGLKPGTFGGSIKDWEKHIHPEDLQRIRKEWRASISTQDELEFEYRTVRPDKKIRWIYSKSKIYFDKNKKPVRAIGIKMDITDRKRLERQKDEFLSIASHELKTPITSIKAFVQILQKYFVTSNNGDSARYLKKMDNQVDRLTKLVQDLLDVSKIQTGKLEYSEEVFDFDKLIGDVIDEMQPLTSQHIIRHEGNAQVNILADKFRIAQVITNLLSNAIKYSPQGKEIIVKTSFDKSEVTVAVKDFGIGVPQDKMKHLFERFYRVQDKKRESFPGLGLGLYISARIIERQGGKMWVESVDGKGSTFYFCLPIHLYSKPKVKDN